MIWTQALADATELLVDEPCNSELDADIHFRATEYARIRVGHVFEDFQVQYTHCLLQRLDTYKERASHLAFKKAWNDAQ